MNNIERAAEAHTRAVSSTSFSNYPVIFAGFMEKGIPEADILPRENIFTYHAWRHKGRQVRKGQRGVRITTWITLRDKDTGEITGRRPKQAVVFHISQTEEAQVTT